MPIALFKPQDDVVAGDEQGGAVDRLLQPARTRSPPSTRCKSSWAATRSIFAGVSIDATGDLRKPPRSNVQSDMDREDEVIYSTCCWCPRGSCSPLTPRPIIDAKSSRRAGRPDIEVTLPSRQVDQGGFPDFVTAVDGKLKTLIEAWVAQGRRRRSGLIGAFIGPAIGKIWFRWVMDKGLRVPGPHGKDDVFTRSPRQSSSTGLIVILTVSGAARRLCSARSVDPEAARRRHHPARSSSGIDGE